jgi:hypothetical protein
MLRRLRDRDSRPQSVLRNDLWRLRPAGSQLRAFVLIVVWASSAAITAPRSSLSMSGDVANCSLVLLAARSRKVLDSSILVLITVST